MKDLELGETEPENNEGFDSLHDIQFVSSEGSCPNSGGTTHDFLYSCGYDAWSDF
jgi:NADH:ubiquinone oxidoreductase subunit B-like Fe-S oxidoreductase